MEIYAIENRPRKSKAAPRRMRSRFRSTLRAENRFPVFYASPGTLFFNMVFKSFKSIDTRTRKRIINRQKKWGLDTRTIVMLEMYVIYTSKIDSRLNSHSLTKKK